MADLTRGIRASAPLLVVSDLRRAVDFYTRVLGYQDPSFFGTPESLCILHRGDFDLILSLARSADQVQPHGRFDVWDLYLTVSDLDAEQLAIEAAGGKIRAPARVTEYQMREIEIDDPDGHRLCLGQELEPRGGG
jgi:predicted enzyme related to lactoylglutathione lyase